jgi:diadenosine tetraphosphate (Ap4A) HIT family hydrolase
MSCTFCRIRDEKRDKIVYETIYGQFFALYDAHPVTWGHLIVIPKRHIETPFELNVLEAIDLLGSFRELLELIINPSMDLKEYYEHLKDNPVDETCESFCKQVLTNSNPENPTGCNFGVNVGKAAGQTVPHLHIHFIPRREGDTENPEGGVRGAVPGKRSY